MALMQISQHTTINASHVVSVRVTPTNKGDESSIVLKSGKTYETAGDWASIWRKLLKSGAIWTDGKTMEYRS
jgi:hypothetical protein